jgi:hypothetical protein
LWYSQSGICDSTIALIVAVVGPVVELTPLQILAAAILFACDGLCNKINKRKKTIKNSTICISYKCKKGKKKKEKLIRTPPPPGMLPGPPERLHWMPPESVITTPEPGVTTVPHGLVGGAGVAPPAAQPLRGELGVPCGGDQPPPL